MPACTYARVNDKLLRLEKTIDGNLTGLDSWDATVYPYQQVLWNIEALDRAIGALAGSSPDTAAALDAITSVDRNSIAVNFGPASVDYNLGILDPGFDRLCFGESAHLPPVIDLTRQYHQIEAGQITGPLARLKAVRTSQVPVLSRRLARMAQVLEAVTPTIQHLH